MIIGKQYEEQIPEPPESGRHLFRDGLMVGLIAMIAAWSWTLYKKRRDNYDENTLTQVYGVRAHIEHAMQSNNIESRMYHLSEAESHCRKALDDLGGGYLLTDIDDDNKKDEKISYDPQIIALHVQLGKICYLLQKFQSAIDNYLIVLKALTQEFGYKSLELVTPCRQISDCYMNLGQNQMSALFLERALKVINEATNGDVYSNNEYAPICQQMAVLLRKQFKWKESIKFTNYAIKGAKSLLGDNHIQIAHMLLGRACCEMELKQWQTAEKSARQSLKIVESGANQYSQSTQNFEINNENNKIGGGKRLFEGGIRNTLKEQLKTNMMGNDKTESEIRYEQEMQLEKQRQQLIKNATTSGISTSEQLVEMKCSILYILGQTLLEQDRLNESKMVFNNALIYATKLNDTTKQLLIHDQLRDIQGIIDNQLQTNQT